MKLHLSEVCKSAHPYLLNITPDCNEWHPLFCDAYMNYREYIKHIFSQAQSVLKEYTILCMKAHSGHDFTDELLKECDEKFKEYNRLLSLHHQLLKKVTRKQITLDEMVSAADR